MSEFSDSILPYIEERHVEVFYNGSVDETEDVIEYLPTNSRLVEVLA